MRHVFYFFVFVLLIYELTARQSEAERRFRISESAARGEHIGWIAENASVTHANEQNYFVVFPEQAGDAEKLLDINERTGEIVLRNSLDYEKTKELRVIAMPVNSTAAVGVKIIIEVVDENDNTPHFSMDTITLEISEHARLNTELALPAASDADNGAYGMLKYRIVSGNINNMFRVASHLFDGVLYADLIVNGQLDREYRERYRLLVEASDGGKPPRSTQLEVHVVVLDANDNAPEFSLARYSAGIPNSAGQDFPVIKITAKDADTGENGRVSYKIVSSDAHDAEASSFFRINAESGLITVADEHFAELSYPPSTKFNIIISATDHGQPTPLESTTLLTITVENSVPGPLHTDDNMDALPFMLDVVWLTDDAVPSVSESAAIGYILARITIENADKTSSLVLLDSEVLCLRQTESPIVYLMLVCGILDRERRAFYQLNLLLRSATDEVILDYPLRVDVTDANDHSPVWNQTEYRVTWKWSGYGREHLNDNNIQFTATDADAGENARIRYTLQGSNAFTIHPELGYLNAANKFDCAVKSRPIKFRVLAEDNGTPHLSSSVDVVVNIIDKSAQMPIFSQALYEINIREDTKPSTCFLRVNAVDFSCSSKSAPENSGQIHYSIRPDGKTKAQNVIFRVGEFTGQICLASPLDYETARHHELVIVAENADGKLTSTRVLIFVQNVDDTAPIFYGVDHWLALRVDFNGDPSVEQPLALPILEVSASDADAPSSVITYSLQYDKALDAKTLTEFFHIDPTSGILFAREPISIPRFSTNLPKRFKLRIVAQDIAGHVSQQPAVITVELLEPSECGVAFGQRIYEFAVSEELMPGIAVGHIDIITAAKTADVDVIGASPTNFELKILDEHVPFSFDENTLGKLVLNGELDAEAQVVYEFTVEARNRQTLCRNYTEVKVVVHDVNDNAPIFIVSSATITVMEDYQIHKPFFTVYATDRDRQENGRITFELLNSEPPAPIIVNAADGRLSLTAPLDYESVAQYRLQIRAQDCGVPPRYSTTIVDIDVGDVNDNAPIFQQPVYNVNVAEDANLMQSLLTIQANDRDSGVNGEITYSILDETAQEWFGIDEMNKVLYLRQMLDREKLDNYVFVVVATDYGTPPLASNTSVRLRVLDVNDHAPNCSAIHPLTVSVNHELSDVVGWAVATDTDDGVNASLTYRLLLPHPFFDIKSKGDVYLRRRLAISDDAIHSNAYVLSVVVEDGGADPRIVVCRLILHIAASLDTASDVVFLEPLQRVILVNISNAEITQINATNVAKWRLEGNGIADIAYVNENGLVRLQPSVDAARLFHGAPTRSLTVGAVDARGRAKYVTLTLRAPPSMLLADKTINATQQPLLRLTTGLRTGTRLLNVAMRSRFTTAFSDVAPLDIANPRAFYKIFDCPTGYESLFELDELTGDLYLNDEWALRRVLRSRTDELELRILEHAFDAYPNRTTLVFDVSEHDNSLAPNFNALVEHWNVSENAEIGSIVGRVGLVDANGRRFRFDIAGELGGSAKNRYFRIDIATGDVYLQRQLDYRTASSHIVVLEAKLMKNSSTQNVNYDHWHRVIVVEVVDENDHNPEFLSRPNCTLTAEMPLLHGTSTPIHYFVAVDQDAGLYSRVTYDLMDGNEDELFKIDSYNGGLTVRNWTAVYAHRFPLRLSVRAWDCDGCSSSTARRFTDQHFIIIADTSFYTPYRNSGAPKLAYFTRSVYEFTMTMDAPPNTVVYNFLRSDYPRKVAFRVFPSIDPVFVIGEHDGILKTTRMLTNVEHSATVFAFVRDTDNHTRIDRAALSVRLIYTGAQLPRIAPSSCGVVAVPENVAVGNLARVFAHVGGGAGANAHSLHFKIEGGTGSQLFTVDERSGVVSCKELDREEKDEHLLVISVSDESTPKKVDVCMLRVRVLDENDNVPQFDASLPDAVEISDETALNSTLLRVVAHDADDGANGRLRYRLNADRSRMLDLDSITGELIFARELAFAGTNWIITVSAEDCGATRVLTVEKQLRILWKRRPNVAPTTLAELALRGRAPPRFLRHNYVGVVAENQSHRQLVARVETDWPRSSPLLYRIVSGNADGAFDVDEQGGVFNTRTLDAERQPSYRLKVIAAGRAAERWIPVPETRVDIHVLSLNDNSPVLTPIPRLVFPEDLELGSLVATAYATDADANSVLEYTLNPVSEYFAIGRYTGAIYLTMALDRERVAEHTVGVQVYDGEFVARVNFSVGVLDVNDNAPHFNADVNGDAFVELEVASGTTPGVILRRFSATDSDADENGAVSYVLAGDGVNTSRPYFALNKTSGDLRLLRRLAENAEYFLEIRASDAGVPQRIASLTVRVIVIRRDPAAAAANVPIFISSIIKLSIPENVPPFLPFANAKDWLASTAVMVANMSSLRVPRACGFRVIPNEDAPMLFASNPSTGDIYVTDTLDRESTSEQRFRVTITAAHCGSNVTSGTDDAASVEIVVTVLDSNDNAPRFNIRDNTQNVTAIAEVIKSGTVLTKLTAQDQDTGDNGDVVYELLAGNRLGILRLNAASGVVVFDHWDDAFVDELFIKANTTGAATPQPSLTIVVGARDAGTPARVAYTSLALPVDVASWSGAAPRFVTDVLRKFVLETTAIGTRLFNVAAISRLPSTYRHSWSYFIEPTSSKFDVQTSLVINTTTGDVHLSGRLDYETLAVASSSASNAICIPFRVGVEDCRSGWHAAVPLQLYVVGVDEYAPVFSKLSYTFQVPYDAEPGMKLGAVDATDRDAGVDGRVRYDWRVDAVRDKARRLSLAKYFRLNATSGAIFLRRPLPLSRLQQLRAANNNKDNNENSERPLVVRLTVVASSGVVAQELSTKAIVYFEIGKEQSENTLMRDQLWYVIASLNSTVFCILFGFITLLFCFAFVLVRGYCRNHRQRRVPPVSCTKQLSQKKSNSNNGATTAAGTKRQVYSVANNAKLLLVDDTGRDLTMSPTFEHLRLPPPPNQPMHSMLGSRCDESRICSTDMCAPFAGGPLSQPDSGIDPDVISMSSDSAATECLSAGQTRSFIKSVAGMKVDITVDDNRSSDCRTAQILSTHNFRPYQPRADFFRQAVASRDRRPLADDRLRILNVGMFPSSDAFCNNSQIQQLNSEHALDSRPLPPSSEMVKRK